MREPWCCGQGASAIAFGFLLETKELVAAPKRAASDDIVSHVEIKPRWRGIPLALQASSGYARCRADSELILKMTDADKIVAATFAVARCGGLGHSKPEDYIAEYDIFLRLLDEREATAERAENDASLSPWKFGS